MESKYANVPAWAADLDPREWAQIRHALDYTAHHIGAGAPGHGQFVLIAKLANKLTSYADREGPAIEKPE